ncbi:MAG: hypothetical protein AB7F86_15780 [Bdellovibrionales bacterium]
MKSKWWAFALLTTTVFVLFQTDFCRADQEQGWAQAMEKAAKRAHFVASEPVKADIKQISHNLNPYGFFASKKLFAQRAILDQLEPEERLLLLRYRTSWLRASASKMAHIDSNFSAGIKKDVGEIHQAFLLVIQSTDEAGQWYALAIELYRTLRVLDRITRKPFLEWVPYRGEADPQGRGRSLIAMGMALGNGQLAKMGAMVASGHTPVHELIPDNEMKRAVRFAFESMAASLTTEIDNLAETLGVSSPVRLAANLRRPRIRPLAQSMEVEPTCAGYLEDHGSTQ